MPEALEGKSILDLSNGQFYSYSFKEDSFIWIEYYPSPNGKKLAVVGCYWAYPYEIIIFDTSKPTQYPYKELYRQDSFGEKLEWLDDHTLQITEENQATKIITIE